MPLKLAILGRPNVGKSTLFNRLTGSRRALVHHTPGLTRDRIEGKASLDGIDLEIVDTAGLEPGLDGRLLDSLRERLVTLSMKALDEARAALLLIDARAGVSALDEEIAGMLRRQAKPVILVANKCEGRMAEGEALDAWRLGLGEPVMLSAEHGLGLDDLARRLEPLAREAEAEAKEEGTPEDEPQILRLAVVGRPNSGKSTLVNRLLGNERSLTGPEPGLTRDSIHSRWSWRGRTIELIDTAGLRRKAKIDEQVEKLTASSSVRAIREAEVVLLLVDATRALEKQDFTIANLALDQGRALVVAVSKWDLVDDPRATLEELRHKLRHRLSQLPDLQLVTISASEGRGLNRLMQTITEMHERWSSRITTGKLNRWLESAIAQNPPPMAQNRRIKLRYATQVSTRPPTIAVFSNKPADDIPNSYMRYLAKSFAARFDMSGILVRLVARHGENPHDPRSG